MEHIIHWLFVYKYLVIFLIAIVEGPVIAMICGFFLRLGVFSLVPLFICLMVGDVVSDMYWYAIGYHGGRSFLQRFGKYFSVSQESLERVERLYNKRYKLILFLSKLTMGFGFAVAIVAVAGAVRVPFKKYMIVNILSQPIWTATLMSIGYFLGSFYIKVNKGIELMGAVALTVIVLAAFIGFTRYMRRRVIEYYL